jgi:hypothetical protein
VGHEPSPHRSVSRTGTPVARVRSATGTCSVLAGCFTDDRGVSAGLFLPCSGDGGRFDAGTLYISPQVGTTDNTDALSRVRLQCGRSLAYPASTMGARASTAPNRQTLRSATVKTRTLIVVSHWVAAERTHPDFLILSTASATSSGCSLRARPALPACATLRSPQRMRERRLALASPCLATPTAPRPASAASSSRTLSMLRSVRAARRRGAEGGV